MPQTLFHINNLSCAYRQQNGMFGAPVLKIEQLQIPKGKIVVLLGKSGAGKSTILETLGLMNDTMTTPSQLLFTPSGDQKYHFETVWKDSQLDNIRKQYFSFIFQNTNLMPNFTVYENICLTQMIQGASQAEAMKKARDMMHRVGLQEVDEHKKPHELSGGQRQRVAFVRAITPNFTVLFGDEPTGNLDEINSRELMTILTDNIREHQRTAIIVTHNIDLALEFADQIIILTKDNDANCGQVAAQNIFYKQSDPQGNAIQWAAYSQHLTNPEMRPIIEKLIR